MSASIEPVYLFDPVYLLWERGMRGPTPSKLFKRGAPLMFSERERKEKLSDPILLDEACSTMSLASLAVLYPAPAIEDPLS